MELSCIFNTSAFEIDAGRGAGGVCCFGGDISLWSASTLLSPILSLALVEAWLGGRGGNGRGSPSEATDCERERTRSGLIELPRREAGRVLCSFPSNGSSKVSASSVLATSGLMKRQSSGNTTGVFAVSSKEWSKLSSCSAEDPRSKLRSMSYS